MATLECVRRAFSPMIPEMRAPRIDGTTGRFAVDTTDSSVTEIKPTHLLSDADEATLGVLTDLRPALALLNPPKRDP